MKSWEKEAILIRETTEKVTAEVTAEVTEKVTAEVTAEVTETVTTAVTDRDARIYTEDLRDAGVADDKIRQKLITRFGLSPEKADQMIKSIVG